MYFQNLRRRLPSSIKTISREGTPLLTLDDGLGFLRSRFPGDDDGINRTIMSVQRNIEAYAGIRIDEGVFDAYYDSLANELELKDVPATITNVYYTNQDGTEVVMTANTDYVVFVGNSLIIRLKPEGILSRWIDNEVLRPIQYRVRYEAGHEDLADVWPQVKTAMEHELAFYFKNRQDGDQQAVVISGELTIQAKNMLNPIKDRQ